MKKKMFIVLAGALSAAVLMGGCGKNGKSSNGSSAASEKDVEVTAEEMMKATDYDVEDCVTLCDYKGMDIELTGDYDVTDDDVKSYTEQMLSIYPAYEKTDKQTVEDKDIVNIDYEGKIDGKTFSGGSAEGSHLEIGSDSFIDGFEDGLIGKKVGETVELNLKFPDDYQNTEYAGKDVVFTVTINSIDKEKTLTYDTMTDEYVKDNFGSSGITTADDFKAQIRTILESQNEQTRQSDIQSKVMEKLEAECKVQFPEGLVDQKLTEYMTKIKTQIEEQKQTFDEAVGMTEEEYKKEVQEQMEQGLKQELILEAIVLKEGISITESEFSSMMQNYMASMGISSEEDFYKQYGEKDYVRLGFAESKALSTVMNSANVTYAKEAADDGAADKDSSAK